MLVPRPQAGWLDSWLTGFGLVGGDGTQQSTRQGVGVCKFISMRVGRKRQSDDSAVALVVAAATAAVCYGNTKCLNYNKILKKSA